MASLGPEDLAAFVKERNDILMKGDLEKMIAFHKKYNPDAEPIDLVVAEVALHKGRTAITALPMELRTASHKWLIERGNLSYLNEVN
jgi:hypothetical protein